MRQQADIRLSTSKSQLAAANGWGSHQHGTKQQHGLLPQHADSPRTPRPAGAGGWGGGGGSSSSSSSGCWCCCTLQQALSGRAIALLLLLVWVLLAGCFVVRHGTRLLDAAGQQHHLLHLEQQAASSIAAAAAGSGLHWGRAAAAAAAAAATHAAAAGSLSSTNSSSLGFKNLTGDAAVLAAQAEKWPDGYVAICAVVKDQWPDLRYWIEYHRWLGVSKFYIFDNNSTLPSLLVLWDYVQQGLVDYQYFLGRPRRKPDFTDTNQYRAYQACLLQHFRQHRWMAYIDADEFLVFPDQQAAAAGGQGGSGQQAGSGGRAKKPPDRQAQQQPQGAVNLAGAVLTQEAVLPSDDVGMLPADGTAASASSGGAPKPKQQQQLRHSLPLFLSQFEGQAAIGVNWVLFGSSGQQTRPPDGPLAGYSACVPQAHWESSHVKIIANTGGILGMGYTPHEVIPRPGRATVDVDQLPFRGPRTPVAKWHKLVIHHYVLKSRAEFVAKKARGSGAGNRKDWSYWDYVEKLANATCLHGQAVSAAFLASKPALALPPGSAARLTEGCHARAAAAYGALLTPVAAGSDGSSAGGGSNEQQQQSGGSSQHHGSIDEWLPC